MNIEISKPMNPEGATTRQTVVLGVFFLLLVTTYSSFSQIVTFITQHSDTQYSFVGEVSLITNYLVYLIGLTRAPSIVNFKRQFLIAALCYSFNYALYIFQPEFEWGLVASVLGAIVGGYGASVLWVSQGGYMVRLFRINKIGEQHEGKYLGLQNGLVYGNSLLGAIVTTFCLGLFGNEIYFIALSAIAILGFVMCYFILDPLQLSPEEERHLGIEQQSKQNLMANFKQIIKFYPKMRHIALAIILDGLILGFTASYFSHLLPENFQNDLNMGFLLIVHGVGGIIGGYLSGVLSDYIPVMKEGIVGYLFIAGTMILTMLKDHVNFETIIFALFIGFLWGVALYFLQGWIFVCCTKVYDGKIESYAIVKQLHTGSFIIFQLYMIIAKQQINLEATLIVLIALSFLSCFFAQKLQNKLEQKNLFVQEVNIDHSPSDDPIS